MWRSYLPGASNGAGWLAWVMDEDAMYRFDGTAWALAGIEGPAGPEGSEGAPGDPGPAGAAGADGSDPGILFTWDDDNADSDPGAGDIKADNDALGSATTLYVSKTSRGGSNVAAYLLSLDDSGNAGRKGIINLLRPSDEVQATFDLNSVTDATNYVKLGVANHSGSTGFTLADPISFQFAPAGPDGAGAVDSVNGQTGVVVLGAGDIGVTPAGGLAADDVQEALEELDSDIGDVASDLADLAAEAIEFVVEGGGAVIATGIKGDLLVPFACTIAKATLLADQTGSIVVNVWKDTYANFPPTVADKITASAPPTISSATKSQDATLSGWTTGIAAGDILRFNVDSVTSIQRCTLALEVTK